jgi:hypothetical protein
MVSWRPTQREPDALHKGLQEYLRKRAHQVYLDGDSSPRLLGRADMTLDDGRTLAVELQITPVDVTSVGSRDAVVFSVAGQAAEPKIGYEVGGTVVIDKKTLAFLSIDVTPTVVNTRP